MKWEFGRASDKEALRLILAFFKVGDPQRRKLVIELAEAFAEESQNDPLPLSRSDIRRLVQDNARMEPRKL